MKFLIVVAALLLSLSSFSQIQTETKTDSQSKAGPVKAVVGCVDRGEMQEEITETKALVARMQNRVIMMRNSIGTIRDFELRNALQINADAWQDLLDSLKLRVSRLQVVVDRCEAREKINSR
jgi:hypothetical protein